MGTLDCSGPSGPAPWASGEQWGGVYAGAGQAHPRVASLTKVPLCVTVPGPCDPEDLIDGIIFAANYLGSTQLLSDKTPSKNVRMMQAQEAVSRIKVRGSVCSAGVGGSGGYLSRPQWSPHTSLSSPEGRGEWIGVTLQAGLTHVPATVLKRKNDF